MKCVAHLWGLFQPQINLHWFGHIFSAIIFSYPGSPVQAVFHYSNELLVGELVIVINVKDFEYGVNKVTCQLLPRGHVHRSRKLICEQRQEKLVGHLN